MLILLKKKAQSTAEYVTLIALAAAAIGLVNTYVRKTMANKVKKIADDYVVGGQVAGLTANQWQDEDSEIHRASHGTQRNVQKNAGLKGIDAVGKEGAFDVEGVESEAMRATVAGDLNEVAERVINIRPGLDPATWDNPGEVQDVTKADIENK